MITETVRVPIRDLRPHPANPRIGDVDGIRESLLLHGQYRPIVACAADYTILAGHHTVEAMLGLCADGSTQFLEPWVTLVDVDPRSDEAIRVMLIDNALNDKAQWDGGILVSTLDALGDLAGTGFDDTELAALRADLDKPLHLDTMRDPVETPEVECPACGTRFRPGVGERH